MQFFTLIWNLFNIKDGKKDEVYNDLLEQPSLQYTSKSAQLLEEHCILTYNNKTMDHSWSLELVSISRNIYFCLLIKYISSNIIIDNQGYPNFWWNW